MSANLIERYPFWGVKTSKEVKYVRDVCSNKTNNFNIERNCYRDLLKIAINSIETNNVCYENFEEITKTYSIKNTNLLISFYSGLLKLLKHALNNASIKQEYVKDDLRDQLKFSNEFISDFVAVLYNSQKRETIENCLLKSSPHYNKLKTMDWRIDVSISTSTLSRTLEPTIIIKLKLNNDNNANQKQVTVKIFELCMKKFHLLRFSVANILKEIEDLESRQIFKLYD